MRHTNFALALLTAAVLSACGGSDDNNTTAPQAKPKFLSQVSFGDSLSDVGTYQVGAIAFSGGGKYTINGPTAKNWTEIMAATFGLPAPCPAQQGLNGSGQGFFVPVTNRLECTGYAQGGARVIDPAGPGNVKYAPTVGQLTVPVTSQIDNHLTRNADKFTGNEIVFVMAGGNDALQLLTDLETEGKKRGAAAYGASLVPALAAGTTSPATAAGPISVAFGTELAATGSLQLATVAAVRAAAGLGNVAVATNPALLKPITDKATADATAAGNAYLEATGPTLVTKMSQAGADLAALVRTKLLAKGAKYVVVNNLPDLSTAPASAGKDAKTLGLISGLVSGFNTALRANLDGTEANVLYVDLFSVSVDQIKNPGNYGLSNVTSPACAGNSLVCTASTLASGVTADAAGKYLFADSVHPTPYGNVLIANHVTAQLKLRGWL